MRNRVFDIGPGKKYKNICDFDWEYLKPGDTIRIHWKSTPYKERFLIAVQGTKDDPVTIIGVPGPDGSLPLIDGSNALTGEKTSTGKTNINRWIIKVGAPDGCAESNYMSKHILIDGFEIVGAMPENCFIDSFGNQCNYDIFSAGIWVDRGENITIRNCRIHNCSNGLFVNSRDSEQEGYFVSRDIIIEGNEFYDNGIPGSMYEHHTYCAAIGIIYQKNIYGPMKKGAYGYGLKDRSAGTIIKYNVISDGRRQISLDDGEDNPMIPAHRHYDDSFVFGNILIKPDNGPIRLWGDDEIIHFGGDNPNVRQRSGTLYFCNNTVITYRQARIYDNNSLDLKTYDRISDEVKKNWNTKGRVERTTVFLLPKGQTVEAVNNIFYAAGENPAPLVLMTESGHVRLSNNWLMQNWRVNMPTGWEDVNSIHTSKVIVEDLEGNITGFDPCFVDIENSDFHLSDISPCLNNGKSLTDLFINNVLSVDLNSILEHCSQNGNHEYGVNIGALSNHQNIISNQKQAGDFKV